MKHEFSVTILLLALFILSQVLGLFFLQAGAEPITITVDNQTITTVAYEDTAVGERPEFESSYGPLAYLLIGVALGTILLLLLIRLKLGNKIWKAWYFLAIVIAITIALGVFFPAGIGLLLAIILAYIKIKYKDFVTHNLTELLMYAGLVVLLAPLFDLLWVTILLLIISLYDMYAVWKSKHMVALAKFTSSSNLFPGLLVNYSKKGKKTQIHSKPEKIEEPPRKGKLVKKKSKVKQAILGGGDMVFPLLFTGVVFTSLLGVGYLKTTAFFLSLIVTVGASIALFLLLYMSRKSRFYPAMPFLSAGCFVGYGLMMLVMMI